MFFFKGGGFHSLHVFVFLLKVLCPALTITAPFSRGMSLYSGLEVLW